MSVIVMEGRRFKTDHEPLESNDFEQRQIDAALGSAMLRDAILRLKGLKSPHQRPAQQPKEPPHKPHCCAACGAPFKANPGLVSHIQATVAAYYKVQPSSMVSQRRSREIAYPRQVAMYLAAELTPKSLPAIGRYFGGRDHTTVMHAIRAVRERMENDAELALDVEALRERLEA
jgi:hypothetical protein